MNVIVKSVLGVTRAWIGSSAEGASYLGRICSNNSTPAGSLLNATRLSLVSMLQGLQQARESTTLKQMHKRGPLMKKRKNKNPFDGAPFMKGVVLKTLIKKPKKPNSGNRKCVLVRLSNGKEMTAYVPGIGHNLQEHNVVLCRNGRLRDTPGVKIKCVRGKYDLPHVIKDRQ